MPRAYTAWTTEEQAVLRVQYPKGGAESCLDWLPGRSRDAIASRAGFLGLRIDAGVLSDKCRAKGRKGAAAAPRAGELDHRALAAALGMNGAEPASLARLPARVHRIGDRA